MFLEPPLRCEWAVERPDSAEPSPGREGDGPDLGSGFLPIVPRIEASFRKNIGRALLASLDDPYLETWNLDLTTRDAKARYGRRIDTDRQAAIERRVTEYIQGHFRVVLIEVDAKDARLRLESRLISTVSLCQECRPSSGWLGLHSPKRKIRDSGLWAVNELYKEPLSSRQLEQLERTGGGQQS